MRKSGRGRKGYRIIFLTVFAVSLLAEVLLFLFFQVNKINSLLNKDFRVVFISARSKRNIQELKEEIKSLPGVRDVEFISADKRLDELKAKDAEFSKSVMILGKNLLPDTFEVKLSENVFGGFENWLKKAEKVKGISEIKYKAGEVSAILHLVFYRNFIYICFALFIAAIVLMVIMALTYKFEMAFLIGRLKLDINWFLSGAFGSLTAVLACYTIVYPIKYLSPIWHWPNFLWHLVVVLSGGFIGWVIYQWKITH